MSRIMWDEQPPRLHIDDTHWSGSVGGVQLFDVWFNRRTQRWAVAAKLGDFEVKPYDFDTVEAAKAKCERVLVAFLSKIGAALIKEVVTWRKDEKIARSYDGFIGDTLAFTIRPVGSYTTYVWLVNERAPVSKARGHRCRDVAEAKRKANELLAEGTAPNG